MRIIFLDVDGVLNHAAAFREQRQFGSDVLDPDCVQALTQLCVGGHMHPLEAALVVLSSTWRLIPTADRLIRVVLHSHRIEVHPDPTPGLSDQGLSRGAEIGAWLGAHPGVATSYVVLDDDPDAGEGHAGRIILTDFEVGGLTAGLAARAFEVLREPLP